MVGVRVSGQIVAPSADWVTVLPGEGLRAALDARVTIETDDHEIIGMSYNGRFYCDPANADRYRKHELLKAGDCYIITAPTFQTKSEKYAWLNNVQAVGKMVEYICGGQQCMLHSSLPLRAINCQSAIAGRQGQIRGNFCARLRPGGSPHVVR
jgi:hypothetical protein